MNLDLGLPEPATDLVELGSLVGDDETSVEARDRTRQEFAAEADVQGLERGAQICDFLRLGHGARQAKSHQYDALNIL